MVDFELQLLAGTPQGCLRISALTLPNHMPCAGPDAPDVAIAASCLDAMGRSRAPQREQSCCCVAGAVPTSAPLAGLEHRADRSNA